MNIQELKQAVEEAEKERIKAWWVVKDLEDDVIDAERILSEADAEYETLIEQLYEAQQKEIAERKEK